MSAPSTEAGNEPGRNGGHEQTDEAPAPGWPLADWVLSHLGTGENIAGVFDANLRLAVKAMTALNASPNRVDEETLTAALLGSLIASLPLSVLAFGPTDDPGGSFGWSQYKKSGSDPLSESAKGADFALMMSRPSGKMRLIVFQAKTDSSLHQREGTISLSQSRKDGTERVFQIERLATHADELLKCVSVPVKRKGQMFVHYLCQLDERGMGLRCIQLKTLQAVVTSARASGTPPGVFKVTEDNSVDFLKVLADGFSDTPTYWLDLGQAYAAKLPVPLQLREIAEEMGLYGTDDGRSGWLKLLKDADLEGSVLARQASPSLEFETRAEPPAAPGYVPKPPRRRM